MSPADPRSVMLQDINVEKQPPKDIANIEQGILDRFVASNVRYQCRYENCSLQFARKDQLHSHEYTHSMCKQFVCTAPNCNKSYQNNSHLQRHLRTAHSSESSDGKFPCSECDRLYKSKQKMLEHHRKVHVEKTDIKSFSFKCDKCPEVFRRKAQCRMHLFSHTGDYPYKCKICDKGFITLSCHERHERTHKVHTCLKCALEFPKWSELVAHKKIGHNERSCTTCGREFHSKRQAREHAAIHNEKDDRLVYPCDFEKCSKYFFHEKNLMAHYRSKHENQRFICDVNGCGQTLCTKQKLLHHIRAVHLTQSTAKVKKPKKPKAPRKDKGSKKTSTASRILNIKLPPAAEKLILAGQGDCVEFEYSTEDICSDSDLN